MTHTDANMSVTSDLRKARSFLVRLAASARRDIASRLLERRIYRQTMEELWSMPREYALELGIDDHGWERFARQKARVQSGRSSLVLSEPRMDRHPRGIQPCRGLGD